MIDQAPTDEAEAMGLEVESEEDKARRLATVEAFSVIVKEKRKDAIQGRAASGIEQEWAEDEAHYEGYDDASSASATPTLTCTALTTAPVSGDTFTIV